jgi:hypothetical protein
MKIWLDTAPQDVSFSRFYQNCYNFPAQVPGHRDRLSAEKPFEVATEFGGVLGFLDIPD